MGSFISRILKEHNYVFAHAQEFDSSTRGQEFKDALFSY